MFEAYSWRTVGRIRHPIAVIHIYVRAGAGDSWVVAGITGGGGVGIICVGITIAS
jgi:hypothetical protein